MSEKNPPPWRAIAIVSLIANLMLAAPLIQKTRAINGIYHYNCTITAKDSETGQLVKIGGASGPGTTSSDVFQQGHMSSFTREGRLEISGIAYEPRTISIGSEGYYRQDFVISDDSSFGSFDVLLKPNHKDSKE